MKPDSFAAVMATGIVSIAAVDQGYAVIKEVLIVLAAATWRRESWSLANLDVSLRLCTYIAACAVVGALMADLKIVFLAMLFWAIAIGVYLVMTGLIVLRAVHDPASPELLRPDIWILMGGGVPARDVLGSSWRSDRSRELLAAAGADAGGAEF